MIAETPTSVPPAGAAAVSGDDEHQAGQSWRTQLGVAALGSVATTIVLFIAVFPWRSLGVSNNFYQEAWPAYHALLHGHVLEFLRLGPAYIGSLILRAPFALIAHACGGGWQAVYFATALPCLIVAPVFGAWLATQPRQRIGHGWTSRISPMVLCIFNPIVLMGVFQGHPEEVLGSVLCVAAVVLATRGAAGWSGLLIGLAVVNKSWALVAVPVVLLALPSGHRRALWTMCGIAALFLIPVLIARANGGGIGAAASTLGTQEGNFFLPAQLLWWFGAHSWVVREAHVEIVVAAVACAALWWVTRRHRDRARDDPFDPLVLLMLVLLLRAALDPLDNLYYHVPFLFALMAYETRRTPRLTLLYTCLLLIAGPTTLIPGLSPNVRAALYAAVAVPTIGWLAAKLYLPSRTWGRPRALVPSR